MTPTHDDLRHHEANQRVLFCTNCGGTLRTRRRNDEVIRVCSDCALTHHADPKVAVVAAVVSNERLLLVRRRYEPEQGKWSLPGGFLNAGEDPREAVAREVTEETGLRVSVGDLVEVFFKDEGGSADIALLFQAELLSGEIQPGDDADQAEFFLMKDLPQLAFESTRSAVRALQRSRF